MKASQLAELVGSKVENAPQEDVELTGISTLSDATAEQATFLTDRKFLSMAQNSRAGVILVAEKLAPLDRPHIPLKNVWEGVLLALKTFYPGFERKSWQGVHPTAVIDPTAELEENVAVGPYAVIGANVKVGRGCYIAPGVVIGDKCRLGENCTIYANAVLESETILGNGVFVQAGAVIGADGFKYEVLNGRWTKIPQVGHVELGDHAEVGANSCLDRASYSATRIGKNTKIDNLVQIAHNVQAGDNCIIVSQTGIAGSTKLGDNCIVAAQVGIADNVEIGAGAVLLARTGLSTDVEPGATMFGTPAHPFRQEARIIAATKKLPDLVTQVAKLAQRVEELEARLAEAEKPQ